MTAIDYAALIERLTRKNEDGTLCEITEADQQEAADVIERLIAERDQAQDKVSGKTTWFASACNERAALREQVKTLRAALNDATDIAIGHYGVDSRVAKMALEALAVTEPKEKT